MSTNKNAQLRYQILDRCFSDRSRKYDIDDLVAMVNETLGDVNGTEVSVRPNKELEARIFSYGNQVEVISPQWLREQIAEKLAELMKKYSSVNIGCTDNK